MKITEITTTMLHDPDGYVILVEERPDEKWLIAVLFFLVGGLVAVNLGALAYTLRRL